MSRQPGCFITFEGGEGVGKSTNIAFAAEWLRSRDIEVIITREPGGTPIAETIRNALLKAHHNELMHPRTELLLVFAARAQHIESVIMPALAKGTWVLCDRFTDSTIAYQGFGRGLPMDEIEDLKKLVQQGLEPDRTFLLDAPLEIGMGRAARRGEEAGEETDRFETEQAAFFERVRSGFQALAAEQTRFRTLDASQPLEKVQFDLLGELKLLLKDKGHPRV